MSCLCKVFGFTTATDKTEWFNNIAGLDNGRIGCRSVNNSGNATFLTGAEALVEVTTEVLSADDVAKDFAETRHLFGV